MEQKNWSRVRKLVGYLRYVTAGELERLQEVRSWTGSSPPASSPTKLIAQVPATLTEIRRLGSIWKQRASDVLAFFDRPGTSYGPTEAINGRLEHLRGLAFGFRNLTNYIARSLLEVGGLRPHLHPPLRRAAFPSSGPRTRNWTSVARGPDTGVRS